MKIEIIKLTENPLQHIGKVAGTCWNAPIDNAEQNIKRAKNCIKSGHGRVMEYVDIEVVLEGLSARCAREIYTHIAGTSRLQASTRYISEEDGFDYYTPPKIESQQETEIPYIVGMKQIQESYNTLLERGIAKEDAANLLPLGMSTKMVWKINLRSLVNFCNLRRCTRALKEIRDFAKELVSILGSKNEEWSWIAENLLVPKCEQYKFINKDFCFCTEQQCCGKHPKISDLKITKV